MEVKSIKDFLSGDKVQNFFIIKSVEDKTSSNNKRYLDLNLGDKTGEINGKLWDSKEEDKEKFTVGMLIKVRGTVTAWQNNLQLRIDMIRPAQEKDGVMISDYVPSAPIDSIFMYESILNYINSMKNKSIKDIVKSIFESKKDKLMHYPAAMKNHHSIRGGLLYHIFTMLKVGEKLASIYEFIDKDLLYGGIILHDIEKTEEMDANDLGIVKEYTVEGNLLGHIIQGIRTIDQVAKEVGAEKEASMMLQHMILSHHYEPEFGSPKRPMFPEAELLHHIDMIDARMYDMSTILEGVPKGSFSDKVWSLDNRKLYKSDFIE